MHLHLKHKNGEVFTASNDDYSIELGRGDCFRPMEMFLGSMASCASIDILLILKKQHLTFTNYSVFVDGVRAPNTIPSVFSEINLNFIFESENLPISKLQRAIKLSIEKYCSVVAMLNNQVKINTQITLNNTSYEI